MNYIKLLYIYPYLLAKAYIQLTVCIIKNDFHSHTMEYAYNEMTSIEIKTFCLLCTLTPGTIAYKQNQTIYVHSIFLDIIDTIYLRKIICEK